MAYLLLWIKITWQANCARRALTYLLECRKYIPPVNGAAGKLRVTSLSLELRNPEPKNLSLFLYSFTTQVQTLFRCLSNEHLNVFVLAFLHKLIVVRSKKYKQLPGSSLWRALSFMILHTHVLSRVFFLLLWSNVNFIISPAIRTQEWYGGNSLPS